MPFEDVLRNVGSGISLFALVINFYNCILLVFYSPANIKDYRIFLLTITVSSNRTSERRTKQIYDMFFAVNLFLFQPEPLLAVTGGVVHGPLRFIHSPTTGHVAVIRLASLHACLLLLVRHRRVLRRSDGVGSAECFLLQIFCHLSQRRLSTVHSKSGARLIICSLN